MCLPIDDEGFRNNAVSFGVKRNRNIKMLMKSGRAF